MGFKKFDLEDLIISNDAVTSTVWSANAPTLTSFFTSSTQEASTSGDYYLNVYQTASDDSTADVQFSIAYCDKEGSGSENFNPLVDGITPSRVSYGQYRSLVLGDENADFVFGDYTSSYFYALNVDRSKYKQNLLPGTMTMVLSGSTGEVLSLTDDSGLGGATVFTDAGRRYNLVSGSAGSVVGTTGWSEASGSYGWFLPDVGICLLNGAALSGSAAADGLELVISRTSGSVSDPNNNQNLFVALSGSGEFTFNNKETLSSDYIFVRARNSEFNYSENPSFISGSTGEVLFNSFIDSPTTYITTVGLYNDNNELLAVAKLSRPLKKDFTKELLLRVKLLF